MHKNKTLRTRFCVLLGGLAGGYCWYNLALVLSVSPIAALAIMAIIASAIYVAMFIVD